MLDKKYKFSEKEPEILKYWEDEKVYEFKRDEREVYSIDTPPPTVSGKIHIGHIFSYTQADIIARYKRLRGYNVFYPFGFDDNGLPSERLVEKELNIKAEDIGREEFSKHCYNITNKYEEEFKTLFKRIGLSSDFSNSYKTISPDAIKISQRSFLELYKKGYIYNKKSPALWCNECQTAIAQAELETKTVKTKFVYINFETEDHEEFTIATTRAELLPAIVAVFVNPNDEKNKHLIGKKAVIPLINRKVEILADEKVALDKGTGLVMCCTFGDQTDIEWWNKYKLELREIFTHDGYIFDEVEKYGGMKIKEAREAIINDLEELGKVVKIEGLEHEVQTHERCGNDVEYKVTKQWFIDNMNHKEELLKQGEKIKWYPSYMKKRYDEWVKNLMWDWCISRQRYFGVPFPLWFNDETGEVILAREEDLPVNPLVDKPREEDLKGVKSYSPEKDVMDTWNTSSISPLINMKYGEEENYEDILRPMSLRTNASDIIRTWDFYTILKSLYHFDEKPWDNVMITGFVMAKKGEKISKSKKNAKDSPIELIENYSADVIRYWTASGRLGTDITFSNDTLDRGKKLVNKIWNVSKFIEMHLKDYQDKEFSDFEYFDKYIINKYQKMKENYIRYLDDYEVGLALNELEKFFWNFCDNYIEIVKHRLYRPEEFGDIKRYSGQKTVYLLLEKLLQDFSIYFPFLTEEIYQKVYNKSTSIHLSKIEDFDFKIEDNEEIASKLIDIISAVRGEKTDNNVSLKTEVELLKLKASKEIREAINTSILDFKATLNISNLEIEDLEEDYEILEIKLKLDE